MRGRFQCWANPAMKVITAANPMPIVAILAHRRRFSRSICVQNKMREKGKETHLVTIGFVLKN